MKRFLPGLEDPGGHDPGTLQPSPSRFAHDGEAVEPHLVEEGVEEHREAREVAHVLQGSSGPRKGHHVGEHHHQGDVKARREEPEAQLGSMRPSTSIPRRTRKGGALAAEQGPSHWKIGIRMPLKRGSSR